MESEKLNAQALGLGEQLYISCDSCQFFVQEENYEGCSNPNIIAEHQACCFNVSTGFLSIELGHARLEHSFWCVAKEAAERRAEREAEQMERDAEQMLRLIYDWEEER